MSNISANGIDKIITPPNELADEGKREKWEIIALPDKEYPCGEPVITHHSQIFLKNFTEKLRNEYEDNIREIQINFDAVNREIEIDIRLKSNVLKDELNLLKISGNENIENLISFKEQVFDFEEEEFNKSKLFCQELLEKGKILIDEFYENLISFEKIRSDKFKNILKSVYEKMEKCSYKLPYNIQRFFEEQILHINQILLTNLRNYKEYHVDILSTFVNNIRYLLYNIALFIDEWTDTCKAEIMKRLQSFNLSDDKISDFFDRNKNKTTRELITSFREYEETLSNSLLRDPEEMTWFSETSAIIQELEKDGSMLEVLYSTVATQLSTDIKVKILKEKLLTMARRRSEVIRLESLSFNIDMESAKEFPMDDESLKKLWKITLKEFLQYLHMKYIFLKDLNDLWTNHDKRIEELKLAATTELDQLIEKNDIALQEKQEMPLNIAIDTLRQELNENKMDKSMNKIESILDKMSQTMTSNKDSELKLISKHADYITNESEVYSTAIEGFIEKYERKKPVPVLQLALATKNELLYVELGNVDTHIKDLLKSKKIIIQTIKSKMQQYIKSENDYARLSMEEAAQKVNKKYETKLGFHKLRYERIQTEVYNVRLAEIKKHQERFDEHKAGVEKRLSEIQKQFGEYQDGLKDKIDNFNNNMRETEELCKTCRTSQEAILYEINMKNLIENETNYVNEDIQIYGEQVSRAINQILTSNFNFLQHIKLFHEGGNYNPKEASIFSKKLLQLEANIQKQSSRIKNELIATKKKLEKNFETVLTNCTSQANSMQQILKFKETSEININKLQQELKKEVYQMKYEKKKIDTINERVKQLANTNNFSTVYAVIKYCKELINHCKEYKEYLEDADDPCTIYDKIVDTNMSPTIGTPKPNVSKDTPRKSSKSKRSQQEASKAVDFNIFDNFNPKTYDKFMSRICHIIQKQFQEDQKLAKEFYEKRLNFETVEIPLNLHQYIAGIMQRFKYYFLQCLQTWAFQIQDFVTSAEEQRKFIDGYCNNYIKFVKNQQHDIFSIKLNDFLEDIDTIQTVQFAEIKYIHNQLKPLHGYHGNEHLLLELNNKMEEVVDNGRKNFIYSTEPFQDFLRECKDEYNNKMTEEISLINDLKDVLYDENFCKNLILQAKLSIESTNVENFNIDFPFSVISYTGEDLKPNSEENFGDEIGTPREKLEDEIDTKFQTVEEEADFYEKQIQEIKEMYNQKINIIFETWKADMEKVKNLYTLKYE